MPKSSSGKGLSRRRFLGGMGAAGLVTALGGIPLTQLRRPQPRAPADAHTAEAEHQWAMVVNLRRCDGCARCTRACQKAHSLPEDHEWIKIYEVTDRTGNTYFMPRPCMQCGNAPCLKVCPVAATFKNPEGLILIDQNRCIGCRLCMAACPYQARYFNYKDPPPAPNVQGRPMPQFPVPQQKGTVGKCILCVHNLDVGKVPICVEACSMGALFVGDLNSDVATNGRDAFRLSEYLEANDAFRLKEELNTSPRVWYVLGHGQDLKG